MAPVIFGFCTRLDWVWVGLGLGWTYGVQGLRVWGQGLTKILTFTILFKRIKRQNFLKIYTPNMNVNVSDFT